MNITIVFINIYLSPTGNGPMSMSNVKGNGRIPMPRISLATGKELESA